MAHWGLFPITSRELMRVIHLCSVIAPGGAAHAMLNLHEGLLRLGVESLVLAEACKIADPHFVQTAHRPEVKKALAQAEMDLIWSNRTDLSNTHFSLDLLGQHLAGHPLIQSADVINLHWTAGFLSSVSLAQLAGLGKPVVWTLHDIQPLTGGCHFASGCVRFYNTCGDCPQLKTDHWEMTKRIHSAMKTAVSLLRPHYVAPSEWMRHNIRHSGISYSSPVSLIPYGVDSAVFKPGPMRDAREKLGLSEDCRYILLASHSLAEKRKGAAYAIDILQQIRHSEAAGGAVAEGKLRLLCCGHDTDKLEIEGWEIDRFGFVTPADMVLIYQSANALLFTSIEDNLPNVIMEAMACGLPVVAHSVGGAIDLLGGETAAGLLFDSGDSTKGSASLLRLFAETGLAGELASRGTGRIAGHYSMERQAGNYVELYRTLKAEREGGGFATGGGVAEGSAEQLAISVGQALDSLRWHESRLAMTSTRLSEALKAKADSAAKMKVLQSQLKGLRSHWWMKLGKRLGTMPDKQLPH